MLLLVLLLVGCTSVNSTNYENSLQSMMGVSPEVLVHVWGEPDNVEYITSDEQIFTYLKDSNSPVGGETQPYGGEFYYPAVEQQSFAPEQPDNFYYCKTNFIINNGVVVNYNFNGDDCVSAN